MTEAARGAHDNIGANFAEAADDRKVAGQSDSRLYSMAGAVDGGARRPDTLSAEAGGAMYKQQRVLTSRQDSSNPTSRMLHTPSSPVAQIAMPMPDYTEPKKRHWYDSCWVKVIAFILAVTMVSTVVSLVMFQFAGPGLREDFGDSQEQKHEAQVGGHGVRRDPNKVCGPCELIRSMVPQAGDSIPSLIQPSSTGVDSGECCIRNITLLHQIQTKQEKERVESIVDKLMQDYMSRINLPTPAKNTTVLENNNKQHRRAAFYLTSQPAISNNPDHFTTITDYKTSHHSGFNYGFKHEAGSFVIEDEAIYVFESKVTWKNPEESGRLILQQKLIKRCLLSHGFEDTTLLVGPQIASDCAGTSDTPGEGVPTTHCYTDILRYYGIIHRGCEVQVQVKNIDLVDWSSSMPTTYITIEEET